MAGTGVESSHTFFCPLRTTPQATFKKHCQCRAHRHFLLLRLDSSGRLGQIPREAFSSRTEWDSKVILKGQPFVKEKSSNRISPRWPLNNSHNAIQKKKKKKEEASSVCEFVNKSVKADPGFIFNMKNRERPSKACLEV